MNGRVATSGTSCTTHPPVFYLTGPNAGFVLGTESSALLGQLVAQSATAITAGNYYFGTMEAIVENQIGWDTVTGVAAITGNGGITGTEGTSSQNNEILNETLTVNSGGTFSTAIDPGVIMGLVVSSTQLVMVNDPTTVWPTIIVFNASH
jgi:hypothetical protein